MDCEGALEGAVSRGRGSLGREGSTVPRYEVHDLA